MEKKAKGKNHVAHAQIHEHPKPRFFGRVFYYTVLFVLIAYALLLSSLVNKP